MLWYYIAGVVFAVVIIYAVYPRKRYHPGPPIMGVLGTVEAGVHVNDRHRYWRSLTDKNRIVQLQRGNVPVFVIYQPDDVKFVLGDKTVFPDRPRAVLSQLGPNVLSMPANEEWAKHRRLLSPLFAEKFMREYVLMMNDKLRSFSNRIRRDAPGSTDVLKVVMSVALDFIGICGFGVDFGATETDGNNDFMLASTTLLEESARRTLVPWYIRLFQFSRFGKAERAVAVVRNQCDTVRRLFYEMKESNEFNRKAMITELFAMQEAGEFTAQAVTSEMAVLLLAGHETTATTVSWALYYIARDHELQKRLQAQVDAAFAMPDATSADGGMTIKALDHVPLVKAAMLEALRVRPTVVGVARMAESAFTFPGTSVVCPAGAIVLTSLYSQNMNRAVWGDDVDVFKPERHLDAETEKRHPFAFLPFGAGQRVCLGRRFAIQEGQLLLMRILKDFDVKLPPNAPEPGEKLDITLKPVGLRVMFTERNVASK